MTFSLSIYHISVNPRRKKDERYILSDIEGQNLYDLTDQFLTSWLIQINGVHKSDKFQKATRIGKDEGNPIYFPNGEQIYGIIESGEFGQEMDVVNVDDGSLCHTITAEEAPMFPFFFLFYLPADSRDGFLILQKNGNVGIQSILASEYLNFLKNHLNADCTIKIQSFALHELINKNLNNISEAKAIILKNRGLDIFHELGLGVLDNNGICSEVRYTLGKNKMFDISKWLPKILNKTVQENDQDVLPIPSTDISVEVKMPNGEIRKLSLGNMRNIGANMSLPDDIPLNDKKYPDIDAIRSEAMKLLDYIDRK